MTSSSSLSSIVDGLVRAQYGAAEEATEEELDKHVADLILKEAKKKAEAFSQTGIRAYLGGGGGGAGAEPSNAPKTNKRFLTSIIKSTDDHNRTILQAQAQAALEIKRERDEIERRERRARAEEAVEAEKARRRRGGRRGRDEDRDGGRGLGPLGWADGEAGGEEAAGLGDVEWGGERNGPSRSHRRHDDESNGTEEDSRAKKRRRSTSRSRKDDEPSSSRKRRHSRSPSRDGEDSNKKRSKDDRKRRKSRSRSPSRTKDATTSREAELREKLKHKSRKEKAKSPEAAPPPPPPPKRPKLSSRPPSPSTTPPPPPRGSPPPRPDSRSSSRSSMSITPGPEPALPSKMDKYFDEDYDPRLDVDPLHAPNVPATGLINNEEYIGWDAMLELIRQRAQDKTDKKHKGTSSSSSKTKVSTMRPTSTSVSTSKLASGSAWGGENASIMNIEYKKRGTVREWDMGKGDIDDDPFNPFA
ncbi:hypothetical protein MKEN_01277900 [Mycena kentingensis (nom. inval.)]|nr:hypothetical protein MKEN_01277900 [Mycena kentingensis (nom. inval.)]